MPLDLPKLRRLVSLDASDALSRFALAKKLYETAEASPSGSPEATALLTEAAEHLTFANGADPGHLATYHILGQALLRLGRTDEARRVLQAGIERTSEIGEGMGRDLGPAMQTLLAKL